MSRYIRTSVPGGTFFFTVNLADRSSDLLVREIDRLRVAYGDTQRQYPFETIAICVMPDHLHAIWRLPEGAFDFGLRWQQVKRRFSLAMDGGTPAPNLSRRREKGIWQRRYWEHQIRDEQDLERHVHYVHFNPVKHGWVRRVEDWPHSSFHRWVARGDLPRSWGLVEAAEGVFGERR